MWIKNNLDKSVNQNFPFLLYRCLLYLTTKKYKNPRFRRTLGLLTHLLQFAWWSRFTKCFWLWNVLIVLENVHLEKIIENGFNSFCIFKANPILPFFMHKLLVFCIYTQNIKCSILLILYYYWYWSLLIGGSSNS